MSTFLGFEYLWGLCALRNGMTFDRLPTFCHAKKTFKHASYQNVWRHLAESFEREPNFLRQIYRPSRTIQRCEGGIAKFLIDLEIVAQNRKNNPFFRG